jgi:putative membrane protein
MSNLKRLLFGIFSLLLVLAVLAFVLENQQSVSLLFLGWSGPQLPVSVVTVGALLTGMVMGPLISVCVSRAARVRRKPVI